MPGKTSRSGESLTNRIKALRKTLVQIALSEGKVTFETTDSMGQFAREAIEADDKAANYELGLDA